MTTFTTLLYFFERMTSGAYIAFSTLPEKNFFVKQAELCKID